MAQQPGSVEFYSLQFSEGVAEIRPDGSMVVLVRIHSIGGGRTRIDAAHLDAKGHLLKTEKGKWRDDG